ncbi:MAG: VOC family protein [Saprospiraceae bacterium]
MMMKVENTIPVLPVRNLKDSINYYVDVLGFKVDWKGAAVGSVSRDGCSIMLSELTNASAPGWVWIGLQDATLFEEFKRKGVRVYQEPLNYDWGYEMKFQDLDANVLWLATSPREDLPMI